MSMYTTKQKVVNGKVQTVYVFSFPKSWEAIQKQYWLLNHGWSERSAYMTAFNISETEMQRIEND